jgi:hypothetical protein
MSWVTLTKRDQVLIRLTGRQDDDSIIGSIHQTLLICRFSNTLGEPKIDNTV